MPHREPRPFDGLMTRREVLSRAGLGLGSLALGGLLAGTGRASGGTSMAAKAPPSPAKAKQIIHLFMNGGPSQVDTFDPKPELDRRHGEALSGENLRTERRTGTAFRSPFRFDRYGESGLEVSEIFRHVARHADDLCVIRSMHADVPNHEPSLMLMNCGDARLPRPSVGSWLTYGLGTENQNLPGFVVMCPNGYPIQESQNWQSAFLPGIYQGTYVDTKHTELEKLIAHVRNHRVSGVQQREQLDLLDKLNQEHWEKRGRDAELEARIQSFELAYRMQSDAADAFDVRGEPEHVRAMYGEGVHGRQLLIARRLLERGVRYVQVWHGDGQPWDAHDDLWHNHKNLAGECDRPIAALLTDLKRMGMLDETLVIWGGEFGRTPTVELPTPGANAGKLNGRDHNHHGFTMWLAGGGVKGGYVHGATDEFGFKAVDKPMHVHDLHATILHLMGFDHETFTYRHAGRDFRLTDVHGKVVREILA